MNLDQASIGQELRVLRVGEEASELRNRLYALGIYPGVSLQILRSAPMGDPLQVRSGGTLISIRRQEAGSVEVLTLDQEQPVGATDPEIAASREDEPLGIAANRAVTA